jgi:indolepyruvate decarboxylase
LYDHCGLDFGIKPEVRQAIERSDCLICVGTRFTDVASGLFTHQLNSRAIIDLQPFGLKAGDEYFNAVGAAELLWATREKA